MSPNPLLKKLGFSDNDRVVIIHVDDVGMCQASLQAFADLWDAGTITSGSVMTPCPWFPATAAWAREHPDVDLGVHATVNSEWDGYRWGPISTRDRATGLMDADGYFHHREPGVVANADPDAVRAEVDAQVEQALAAGIDVTHIDTHMFTLNHPRFIPGYMQTLLRYGRPGLVPRFTHDQILAFGLAEDEAMARRMAGAIRDMEASGFPLIDAVDWLPLEDPTDHIGLTRQKLGALAPGITHFLMHPAIDSPELRAMAPDWPSRVANYEAFMSGEIRDYLRQSGIQLIGYRAIRDVMTN